MKQSNANFENAEGLSKALALLNSYKIPSEEYRQVLIAHAKPQDLSMAFVKLKINEMLIAAYRDVLITHTQPQKLCSALVMLKKNGISIETYLDVLIAYKEPLELCSAFVDLEKNGISIETYLDVLIAYTEPKTISGALVFLKENGISIETYRDVLIKHANPMELLKALIYLITNGISISEHRDELIARFSPFNLANALVRLKQSGMLTPLNLRLFLAYDDIRSLTIAAAVMHIDEQLFKSNFSHIKTILILTSIQADYDRIHALIPEIFHDRLQSIGFFRKIEVIQSELYSQDMFYLSKFNMTHRSIRLVQEYEGRLTQLPLPCHENELTPYTANLHIALAEFKEAKALDMLQDKLQRFITSAEAAISTAQATPSVHNQSLLDKKQAQIHAIQKLITWLSDHRQTLSVAEKALLGAHAVVRLLLNNSTITLPKLTELKDELWRYDQSSLHQQRFLLGLEGHSLWANRQNSPQAQAAFDGAYGIIIKP